MAITVTKVTITADSKELLYSYAGVYANVNGYTHESNYRWRYVVKFNGWKPIIRKKHFIDLLKIPS